MFNKDTVFILGAGASWHYGYPTGEALVQRVISMAERFGSYCNWRLQSGQVIQYVPKYVEERRDINLGIQGALTAWKRVQTECKLLVDRLKAVRPLVIDYFLAWNPSLQPIGKLMIAAVILECEAIWPREFANQNRRLAFFDQPERPSTEAINQVDISKFGDDWCRFLIHKIVYGCKESSDLFSNNVRFVTFNYDASLEYQLSRGLLAIDFLNPSDATKFLLNQRIAHVYGSVHAGAPTETNMINADVAKRLGDKLPSQLSFVDELEPRADFLDQCLNSAAGLRTIDPHDKEKDSATLELAQKWIAEASVIYILGFGFDENNAHRIGLSSIGLKGSRKRILFTNFGDINAVNKRASNILLGRHDHFLEKSVYGEPRKGPYAEKSIRNVYDALAMDFDALES